MHLSNLRRKLDQVANDMRIIHTVRGVGFRISNELLDAAEQTTATGVPTALRSVADATDTEPTADIDSNDDVEAAVGA